MRITAESHLGPLLAPLPANGEGAPVGEPVEDSNDYLTLDEEMMKIGSLQHANVEWETAETLAIRMLSERSKDLKVLGHLMHCMQHGGSGVRFALSLRLLARSIAQPWWEHAYPFAGKRGVKMRPRLFQQLIQRSVKLVSTLDFHNAEDEFDACQASLTELEHQVAEKALPDDALAELSRQLKAKRPTQQAAQSASQSSAGEQSTSQPAARQEQAATTSSTAKAPELRLEAGNERSNRQALLKMAEFLGEQSPGEPLAYRLRRYAVWSTIQALPAAKENGKTELAPVSADRVSDYREALAKGGDNELWQRIENSLALSPYWLEGHRLSAGLAKKLGHSRCAEAIRDETQRFVERLPGIEALTFNSGASFVDEETTRWLYSNENSGGAAGGGSEAWHAGLEEAREAVADGDLAAALKVLDQGLSSARTPRESAYWRLASADLLQETGLESLAQQHYRTLHQTVTELALEQWEPALVSRLKAAIQETH
ncbi:type VI secretion system protein VasJ [Vreelandella songnenensis]|uniref:Type VI secretion system protein VasJ n=1 Tax=Vreelandella songnenensis TaxID=1176243 RepID=A0A2T0V279_9GAMM|nr:type VI secretion system protein TssA [Halomonas songnenensis]PRY64289.1 type VI secretion system protein VasJ [Halomonas songnenensis]